MPNMEVVQCPFYITHSRGKGSWQNSVTCERIKNKMGFKMRNMLRFYKEDELEAWLELFCASRCYGDCPYFKAIYAKYEQDPDIEPEFEQYEEYEELPIRPPREPMKQISLFDYMEERNHEDISEKTESSTGKKPGIGKTG